IPDARHEPRDASGRFSVITFLLLVTSVASVALVSWWMFPRATADRHIATTVADFPAPQLQPDPRRDWQSFHTAEMQHLTTYGWIDKAHGIAHIPIAQAMQDIASQGIPGWPAAPATPKP
ncbi:MAG TPA: hypothetical protein VIZ17_10000, partial [Acetobacteraceae bacterium]